MWRIGSTTSGNAAAQERGAIMIECWDVQFATLLFAHAVLRCDTTSRVFRMGKGLALKHIRSDNHFITQAEIFLQQNATLADISSVGEAALVWLYTGAVGDTLDQTCTR